MKWEKPPLNKIYEALGAIADNRVVIDGNTAKVYSSSRNKYYDVTYEPKNNGITANDNASFWVGYLGYPSIAFLLDKNLVGYDKELLKYLKGFAWKDINQRFKNNFEKTDAYIDEMIVEKYGLDIADFHAKLNNLHKEIIELRLNKLGTTKKPPLGY